MHNRSIFEGILPEAAERNLRAEEQQFTGRETAGCDSWAPGRSDIFAGSERKRVLVAPGRSTKSDFPAGRSARVVGAAPGRSSC